MEKYFEKVKKNFGFGCMRLPMEGGKVRDEVQALDGHDTGDEHVDAGEERYLDIRGDMGAIILKDPIDLVYLYGEDDVVK